MNYKEAIEKLSIYFTSEKYKDDVLTAKSEFFGDVGIDDKESDRYEQWMNIFFDWYLFSRPISGSSLAPASFALEIDEFQQLHGEDKKLFKSLAQSEHSLLQFIKVKGDFAYFKDLFRRRKCKVHNNEFTITLEKGNICDARLIPEDGDYSFTNSFCMHPVEANSFILKEVKALKKAEPEEQIAFQVLLLRMFFKMEQYSHLKLDQIYTRESKVRF
ncbi:MAG: hypothetical protein HRT44_11130 [Bdellovibrionales bacterium]|nr:hypothetical protein [Bdellovibrionales bacterium]NQZ19793.1 hypothetical protein [Bdellovibrionales bacterium]